MADNRLVTPREFSIGTSSVVLPPHAAVPARMQPLTVQYVWETGCDTIVYGSGDPEALDLTLHGSMTAVIAHATGFLRRDAAVAELDPMGSLGSLVAYSHLRAGLRSLRPTVRRSIALAATHALDLPLHPSIEAADAA